MSRLTKLLNIFIGLALVGFGLLAFDLFFFGVSPTWLHPAITVWGFAIGCALTIATGVAIAGIGLFSRRSLPRLTNNLDGGSVSITHKALKNLTYNAIESFDGVLEDRVKIRIVRRHGQAAYSVKAWIGTVEGSTLPRYHEHIRARIAHDLAHCTGLQTERVDLVFYTSAQHIDQTTEGGTSHGTAK